MKTAELNQFVWTDTNPSGGCYFCHRPLRRGDDGVQIYRDENQWLGSAHAQCAKKEGYEVFQNIYGVIERVKV